MRLAFVNSAWPPSWGGGEKWTIEAADWFRGHGHTVVVVGRPASKLLAAAQVRGLVLEEFPFGGDLNPLVMRQARKLLLHHRIQLTVVNFNKEAWQFGLAARRLGLPVVARHGFPLMRKEMHHRWLLEKVISRLVVNAAAIRDEYAQLGLNVSGISVIHNGVQPVEQRPGELRQRFGIPADGPLVLAAGRVEPQKRFDRVREVAAAVVPQHKNVQFVIAGEGHSRDNLERQIVFENLTAHVRFIGFVPDLAEIMTDADLFLLTSDQEGTPNVLLEAMAAGVPCVAFAVGSVPEIFTGELAAFSIPVGDVEQMSARVQELLTDSALRQSIGTLMQRRARNEFSLDHSMEQFEQLFEESLSAPR